MSTGYHHDDEVQQRAFDAHLMRRLLVFVRPYRAWMITAIILLLCAAVVSNYVPKLLMSALDGAIGNPDRVMSANETVPAEPMLEQQLQALADADMTLLWEITWMLAGLMLLEASVRFAQFLIVAYIGQKTMLEMRMALFEHLQRLSLKFIDRNPLGRLMTRVTNDIEKIQQTVVTGVVQVASDLFTIFVVLFFMVTLNWKLTLFILIPLPFIFATSMIFRKYARRSFMEIRRKIASVNAYLQENVNGMRIVQLFAREEQHYETFSERNAVHRDEWLRQVRNFAIYFPLIEFFGSLSMVFIILYCGYRLILLGEIVPGDASIGTVIAFIMYAERFYGPIRALADRYNLLLEAMASSERVFQLLDTPEEIADKSDAIQVDELEGHIEFDGVWFSYEDELEAGAENWVLKDVSFSVAPGERVAIVGHTGAGKTTIISLLNRLYDIQRGAIRIDGVDIRDYDQVTLRRKIGVVLQDVFLFPVLWKRISGCATPTCRKAGFSSARVM